MGCLSCQFPTNTISTFITHYIMGYVTSSRCFAMCFSKRVSSTKVKLANSHLTQEAFFRDQVSEIEILEDEIYDYRKLINK